MPLHTVASTILSPH